MNLQKGKIELLQQQEQHFGRFNCKGASAGESDLKGRRKSGTGSFPVVLRFYLYQGKGAAAFK